jgi:hypothetical protein
MGMWCLIFGLIKNRIEDLIWMWWPKKQSFRKFRV